jgi:phage shock protein E
MTFFGNKTGRQHAVQDKITAGAAILDVRTAEEFSGGHYANALNIPVQVLPVRLVELDKARAVVVYCASGGRSRMATEILIQAGFKDVIDAGGLCSMPSR